MWFQNLGIPWVESQMGVASLASVFDEFLGSLQCFVPGAGSNADGLSLVFGFKTAANLNREPPQNVGGPWVST